MNRPTAPGELDYRSKRTHDPEDSPARAVDNKIQGLMNSALLKVVQFLAIVIVLPIATWYLKSNLEEMREVKAFIVAAQVQNALDKESNARFELFIKEAEIRRASGIERDAKLEVEFKILKERVDRIQYKVP